MFPYHKKYLRFNSKLTVWLRIILNFMVLTDQKDGCNDNCKLPTVKFNPFDPKIASLFMLLILFSRVFFFSVFFSIIKNLLCRHWQPISKQRHPCNVFANFHFGTNPYGTLKQGLYSAFDGSFIFYGISESLIRSTWPWRLNDCTQNKSCLAMNAKVYSQNVVQDPIKWTLK